METDATTSRFAYTFSIPPVKYAAPILLLVAPALHAQVMQGYVADSTTNKPLYPVTILNLQSNQVTITDNTGLYSIAAKKGDEIEFSYVGYKTIKIAKTSGALIWNKDIKMQQMVYQLNEVYLHPHRMSQFQVDSEQRREIYKVPLRRRRPSPVNSPISAIAELFSRKARQTYRFQKDFRAFEAHRFADMRYTVDEVSAVTGLTGDTIGYFMFAYPLPDDFARTATDLELKMWIRDNYKTWRKAMVSDPGELPLRR